MAVLAEILNGSDPDCLPVDSVCLVWPCLAIAHTRVNAKADPGGFKPEKCLVLLTLLFTLC